jgi:hypothetical protein
MGLGATWPGSGGLAEQLWQADAGLLVDFRQGVVLVPTEGAIHQPVVVLHIKGQFVDDGVYFVQRINQLVTILGLSMQHGPVPPWRVLFRLGARCAQSKC